MREKEEALGTMTELSSNMGLSRCTIIIILMTKVYFDFVKAVVQFQKPDIYMKSHGSDPYNGRCLHFT